MYAIQGATCSSRELKFLDLAIKDIQTTNSLK